MIKAIIFDLGGVIIDHGPQLEYFVDFFKPRNREEFWKKLNHFVGPLCEGRMTEEEYWTKIAESENIDPALIPKDLWTKNYEEHTVINNEVIGLIKKLKKHYRLILISNILESHVRINKKRGILDLFDDTVLSNEVRLSKDGAEIFLLALKRNGLEAGECIYIDDIKKFVDTAESAGMKGILFKSYNELVKDLRSCSINI